MLQDLVIDAITKHKPYKREKIRSLLEIPPNKSLGDFSLPCFTLTTKNENPVQLAQTLQELLIQEDIFSKVETKGPYLNFFLNNALVAKHAINNIIPTYPKNNKTVCIESPSPNTNKPLHVGHVRNMCIGRSLVKIYEKTGWNTFKTEIVNDRGIHICKSMVAYKKWGENKTPQSTSMKPDHFVGKYYQLFNKKAKTNPKLEDKAKQALQKWEAGDKETRALWKKMNAWCLEGLKETYNTYNMNLDKQYFESQIYNVGKQKILEGASNNVFEKKEEGVVANLEEYNLGEKILLRSDGTSLYITQDVALAYLRNKEINMDKMLYVVGQEQKYHFKVLFKVLDLLGFNYSQKAKHVGYGFVSLPTGKMSSREGNVVLADDLFKKVEKAISQEYAKRKTQIPTKEIQKRSQTLALATIKFELLKVDSYKDIIFDIKQSIQFKGDTAPYLLYTYARLKSILQQNKEDLSKANTKHLNLDEEKNLILTLTTYKEVLQAAYKKENPSLIIHYLLELTRQINTYYHNTEILVENKEVRLARCKLISQCTNTLKDALNLLDITVLEEM